MQMTAGRVGSRTAILVLALGLIAVVAAQETRPDFGGEWKLNLSKSDFGFFPAPANRTDNIEHKKDALKIRRTQETPNGQVITTDWKCTTDGAECKNDLPGGNTLSSTAKWDGKALVVESKGTLPQGEVTIRDIWQLSGDGKTLTIARLLASAMGEAEQTLVFDKK